MPMYPERNEDLSFHYWLKDKFSATPFVNIVDGFPDDPILPPTISVEWDKIDGLPHELGNRTLLKERRWYVDVFALNKTQRDEFTYKIFNDLQDGVPVNDYNVGFPPTVVPQLGTLIPVSIEIQNLHKYLSQNGTEQETLLYRAVVIFTAVYDQF